MHHLENVEIDYHETQSWLPKYTLGVVLFVVNENEIVLFDMILNNEEHESENCLQRLCSTEE